MCAAASSSESGGGRPAAPASGRGQQSNKVFKNVEVCFMTALAKAGGDGVRSEVARVFRDAGGAVVDSIFGMSLEFNVVSVCVVDPELDVKGQGEAKAKQEYKRTFSCSSVAVLSKEWIFESLRAGRLLPFRYGHYQVSK